MALCGFCDKLLPEPGCNKVIIWTGKVYEGPACVACGKAHRMKIIALEDKDG
jgi:hypothetical protein